MGYSSYCPIHRPLRPIRPIRPISPSYTSHSSHTSYFTVPYVPYVPYVLFHRPIGPMFPARATHKRRALVLSLLRQAETWTTCGRLKPRAIPHSWGVNESAAIVPSLPKSEKLPPGTASPESLPLRGLRRLSCCSTRVRDCSAVTRFFGKARHPSPAGGSCRSIKPRRRQERQYRPWRLLGFTGAASAYAI